MTATITTSTAPSLANEMAAIMRRTLDCGFTPAELGWPDLTPEQLVESERRAWAEEESRMIATATD